MNGRFIIDGSYQLESELNDLCLRARDEILRVINPRNVHALILGGGYGRGEGGVLKSGNVDRPYNDLEFYIIHRGSDLLAEKRFHSKLHHIAEALTAQAGIEVEFKLLSHRKLQRSSVTMFYYDLISGHRLVHGAENWLTGCEHHRAAHRIPLYEATRLLMNRCSGLLYSQEKLARANFTSDEADFVGRNLAKAKLALGDVFLAMRGQYHSSCRERQKRLRKLEAEGALEDFTSLTTLHNQGVDFKLHPVRSHRSREEFRSELESIKDLARQLWLLLESRRLETTFDSVEAYSFSNINKCPETTAARNRLINARRFGKLSVLNTRYPRERLLNSLPLLLWEACEIQSTPHLARLHEQLRTNARQYSDLVRAYESIWRIYN